MADRATHGAEQIASVVDGGCATRRGGRWSRGSQQAHEDGKSYCVAGRADRVNGVEVGVVFRGGVDLAVSRQAGRLSLARQWAFLGEYFIAHAHLHVIGFAGEDHQRFILGLPAETRDRAVVAVAIESARDANIVALGRFIGQQG